MHSLLILILVSLFWVNVNANNLLHHSIPRDIYFYPKYRVAFLKNLPIQNQTAHRWLSDGLKGGQQEFLGQSKEIESKSTLQNSQLPVTSDHQSDEQRERISDPSSNSPTLELLRLDRKSYLCLIPPPPFLPQETSPAEPITPTHSWSLLQPLSGTCLYHRQAWFTYSYCHNVHVRQFRELPVTNHQETGERIVEEDPEWESYTLGRSPLANEATEDIPHDELAIANNLELAHHQTAGQRYLVQRWSDGTMCDKTGRPREVEIQFHCSMTMTDTIIFVKETRTCEYVLVIHTPRLCGEPGFKSHLEQVPEAEIQCREVLNDDDDDESNDSSSSSSSSSSSKDQQDNLKTHPHHHPFRRIPRPPVISPTKTGDQGHTKKSGSNNQEGVEAQVNLLFQKALEQIFGRALDLSGDEQHPDLEGDEGDTIFIALDPELGGEEEQRDPAYKNRVIEMLRKFGLQVEWVESQLNEDKEGEDDEKKHDEL